MTARIIGLGNVLMSDDGFGPYVARVLDAYYEFPAGVEVIDAGTPGLDLTPYLLDTDVVVFVDTVKADGPAGSVHQYDARDIVGTAIQPRLGPHDPGLKASLLTIAAAGRGPREVALIGVVPDWLAPGVFLSQSARAAVPVVVRRVIDELERRGASAHARSAPNQPDTWWERAGGVFTDAISA
jgi:hydrogenase maturation protease